MWSSTSNQNFDLFFICILLPFYICTYELVVAYVGDLLTVDVYCAYVSRAVGRLCDFFSGDGGFSVIWGLIGPSSS